MKLATTTGDFRGYAKTQAEAVKYISQAGFKYLDYNFGSDYSNRTGVFQENWREYLQDLKQTADELGVKFVQSHAPMGKPLGDTGAELLADTLRCVEACGILGIPNVVVHSGYLHGLSIEETYERNKHFFMPILEMGERCNVDILVENFNKMHVDGLYWIDNATDLLGFIEYVNHPRLHAVWDAGHANMQEMSQEDELCLLGSHVRALHIQDNPGDHDSHLMPFYGSLNIDSLMHGLKAIGYEGYFTFESCSMMSRVPRRAYPEDTRMKMPPLEVRIKEEELLYQIGKSILTAYDCFEE